MDQLILGYLNFSEGRPDPRFQRALADAFNEVSHIEPQATWQRLIERLRDRLAKFHETGGAFRDVRQAEAVLHQVFDQVLPAYRAFHADLLFHQGDADLFQPFFVARVIETVLAQGPLQPLSEERVAAVIKQLNDFVGHRPIAVLETRPRGEPYPHERVRPIPLYLHRTGIYSRYYTLVDSALEILKQTDPAILDEAHFDLERLDELALDPRAYDHGHPANRRPNYVFGEWDPHLIDNRGYYRRFVVRQITLDAISARRREQPGDLPGEELAFEAGAVLAGVILMASGVSGSGPETYDSTVTLSSLVPRIARYRDAFYSSLLERIPGAHGERLRQEARTTRQPFGGARQHLNHFLARHRAGQLQQRHLALLMAELGYAEASRRQAARIPAASVRMLSEIHLRLTFGHGQLHAGQVDQAAQALAEVEDLLHRGIDCGALDDPWNILGFGGLYPLFHNAEDSTRDTRADELVAVVDGTLSLYARAQSEAAATGKKDLGDRLGRAMKQLAVWWDRFATYEVSEVRRVHGAEAAASAERVTQALRAWHERGERPADLAFWRDHLEEFRSPKAYALVLDVLLNKEDYPAAQGLLMHWLSQVDQVALEDGEHSFHLLALRWMLGVCRALRSNETARRASEGAESPGASKGLAGPPPHVVKFFDFLEANAQEYWEAPRLELIGMPREQTDEEPSPPDEEEDLFEAAYEGMTFEDSTDDDIEAEVLEVGPQRDFDLEQAAENMEKQLRFLDTVARLWHIAVRLAVGPGPGTAADAEPLRGWQRQARKNYDNLVALVDVIHMHPVPAPLGSYDSLVEYDRRRQIKDRLLHIILGTALDSWLALMAIRSRRGEAQSAGDWKAVLGRLEAALWQSDTDAVRALLPVFLEEFKHEPLLYTPLGHGGHPRPILRASRAQTLLRALAANLPRLGVLHETLIIVQAAHDMERRQPLEGPRITEFDRLFQTACYAVTEATVLAANAGPEPVADTQLVAFMERLIRPYLPLWARHSQTLRVAMLEGITGDAEWAALEDFIRRYGHELFQVRFLARGNLGGILQQGVGAYLDSLEQQNDATHATTLLDALDRDIPRADAERQLTLILQTLLENYDIYKDYNSTAPQSDYGENLYILFDFLRLKARYERRAWLFRPLVHVHEVLARHRPSAAVLWQEQFHRATESLAEQHLRELSELEARHGIRLHTVRDRLEERFVRPLAMDRLCALIEPTLRAAGTPDADRALAVFEEQLRPYADNPTGVGLDVPHWLQRLAATVQQARASRTAIAGLAENLLQIPRLPLTIVDLERQLAQAEPPEPAPGLWAALIEGLSQKPE